MEKPAGDDIGFPGRRLQRRTPSRVGPAGTAHGLDASTDMLNFARGSTAQAGLTNARFLHGHIEDIPLPDGHVDVIISNCVINLSADKARVLTEAALEPPSTSGTLTCGNRGSLAHQSSAAKYPVASHQRASRSRVSGSANPQARRRDESWSGAGQRNDPEHLRAHPLGDPLDRASFPGGVPALEDDADPRSRSHPTSRTTCPRRTGSASTTASR